MMGLVVLIWALVGMVTWLFVFVFDYMQRPEDEVVDVWHAVMTLVVYAIIGPMPLVLMGVAWAMGMWRRVR